MNYLEAGLPHTQFYRKKTQFNPPRSIPLCTLGRKYLGLDPMTKREVKHLINRLSEPKKPLVREEIPAIKDVRPKSTGTGRFVGEKRMDGLQIEKMVARLYSRRATKDFAFVDETVEADDILNMTNRSDDSDSDDDVDGADDRHSSRHVSFAQRADVIEELQNEEIVSFRPKSRDLIDVSRHASRVESKPRYSSEAREVLARTPTNVDEHIPPSCLRRLCSEGNLQRPTSQYSNHSYTTKIEIAKMPRNDTRFGYQRSKSESAIKLQNARETGSYSHKSSLQTETQTKPVTPRYDDQKHKLSLALNTDHMDDSMTSQQNSPRRKFSKANEIKVPRFSHTSGDELLIDKVATYNKSPRLRCK